MKRSLIKIEKLKVQPDETLVVTVGDIKQNILPSQEDLNNWKNLIHKSFPNVNTIIVPDVVKWATLKTKPKEYVVFTIGDSKYNIYPNQKDLDDWKRLLKDAFPKMRAIVAPAVIKGQVIAKNKKHRV